MSGAEICVQLRHTNLEDHVGFEDGRAHSSSQRLRCGTGRALSSIRRAS